MVSNKGRVKSLNYHNTGREQLLKQAQRDKYGHMCVGLCKKGKVKLFLVHQLVGQTFLDNPYNKTIIDHLDCDPKNNKADNLIFCTYKENSNNPLSIMHYRESKRDTFVKVYCITNNTMYESVSEAARELKVYTSNISLCLSGKRNHTGGYRFINADELQDTYELF